MDLNDPYIDHEEEYIGPSSSHLQEHVPLGDGELKQVLEENDQNEDLFVDGIVEDGAYIQGEDGQYYVMVNDGQESGLQLVQLDPDGTEETIYVGNEEEYPTNSDNKDVVRGLDRHSKVEEDDDEDDMVDEDESQQAIMIESIPQGLKSRKNRQYGNCRCPECGTSFVNTARLERHLAVHQVFGSFLCPLCGKTFKYEYNLFYHWRKTCRDLNELVPLDDRLSMDVNAVRQLVDDIAQKKVEIGPIDIGVSKGLLFQSGPLSRLEIPQNPLGRRGNACRACGVVVPANHMPRHLALHRNEGHQPDDRSIAGGFFCDLCGLAFRQHFNLIKHWRTSCPEIQANIPDDVELTMDDGQIRTLVGDLMRKAVTMQQGPKNVSVSRATFHNGMNNVDPSADPSHQLADEGDVVVDDVGYGPSTSHRNPAWQDPRDSAIVYADDFGDEDEMMVVGEDGQVNVASSNTTNWKYTPSGEQCKECFRSFANKGRLERHMAGFHAHFGTHHCLLCGNRFKYEYNLLYHYRRSCPYTKSFIDRDVREQMDATSLRKLVRGLAQKELRGQPNFKAETVRLMNVRRPSAFNEQRVQKEMKMKPPSQVPPQLLTARPGIPDARPCPICSVVFYGRTAVDRHIQAAHNMEPNDVRAIQQADNETMMDIEKGGGQPMEEGLGEYPIEDEEEDLEPPPLLEREEPIPEVPPVHIRFLDQMGNEMGELEGIHLQELKSMIEQDSLAVNDQFIIALGGVEVCFTVSELIDGEDGKYAVFVQDKSVDLPPSPQMEETKPAVDLAFDDNILDESGQ